ncbi:MAG: protein kinase [Cyanobacteria bacterium SBLK]|nr:protein kinase [Cyanobacteria bacterium SBLK]
MSSLKPEKIATQSDRVCYCVNRDCQHPENPDNADTCNSCGSNLLLKNRYRVLKPIGQGGFGRTFQGIDESKPFQPDCAIKQFWVQGSNKTKKAAELFHQEAKRLYKLGSHPQIPELLDYFTDANGQYLVQEFISGVNLSRELSLEGRWDEQKVRQLLLDILPVLQFIHDRRVIHRDVKPENIIRRQSDRVLILVDFGAAKVVTDTALGKTGTVIGSAAYTAPEQVRGKAIFASDLYSLGVTCIHLLTQMPPFDLFDSGENTWQWRHYLDKPVSEKLGKIIDKMLEGATNQRYQSATEVLQDLQAKPFKAWRSQKIWLVGGTVAVLTLAGIVSPLVSVFTPKAPLRTTADRVVQSPPDIGGLYSRGDDGEVRDFPLEHTEVAAKIAGNLSRVEVKQTFTNPYQTPLEAVYEFPLPDDAAVDEMEIRIGDRVIRGNIKKREEAKKIYEKAKQEGKTAGLLEQKRPNIFSQSLANIKPGEKIDVVIRYTNSLEFVGSDYEFVFPLVVASRYTPGTPTGGQNEPNAAWASSLMPETRSGRDINVTVDIDAGVEISQVRSPSHQVAIQNSGDRTLVQLADLEIIPNQDLILRYQVMGAETQATILTQSNQQGGHFATYLIPAVEYKPEEIVPKDVVFLIDTSGSQSGAPMAQSKELMRQFISGLNQDDTFAIANFANTASTLSEQPLRNTFGNRSRALAYINTLQATGGTEFMSGINTVLNFPAVTDGRLRSIVLLTDGLIGNDEQIIAEVRDRLQRGNRLYGFGVGRSTNRFLLDRLADVGRGTVTVVPPRANAAGVAEKFFREINNPVLTNIELKWLGEGEAPDIYPRKVPDLFAHQPLVLHGRKGDRRSGKLEISGTLAGGRRYTKILNVNFEQVSGNGAIAQLWGRSRIEDLMNQIYGRENPEGVQAVTETALNYRLLSKYTAFVAVSDEARVAPDDSTNVFKRQNSTSKGIPEPRTIGHLFAILCLVLFLTRKRWQTARIDENGG